VPPPARRGLDTSSSSSPDDSAGGAAAAGAGAAGAGGGGNDDDGYGSFLSSSRSPDQAEVQVQQEYAECMRDFDKVRGLSQQQLEGRYHVYVKKFKGLPREGADDQKVPWYLQQKLGLGDGDGNGDGDGA
jgi:hypothetical protein